jgi:iron complex outermembrane recepter protein
VKTANFYRNASVIAVCAMMGQAWTGAATAQDVQADDSDGGNILFEEILVTATKKSRAQAVQDVPIAVTAFSERQLDALHMRDIGDLSFKMPNVSLDDIGTSRGTANFAIRGLGINSSIPSIDPTVGVFVDGMYLGLTSGVLFDQFDVESIEVLRGPQGLLFGRNVTGGAVLINTTDPSFEARGKAMIRYESGDNISAAAVYSAPISEKLAFKLGAYYNNDGGWFTNLANNNENFGKAETFIVRPAMTLRASETVELTLRFEHGESDGDGPASQNHGIYGRDTFEFAIDQEGNYSLTWDQAIAELNIDVDFGDGTITNLMGWRQSDASSLGDIDATPSALFDAPAGTKQDQFSNELRYAGRFFDKLDVTVGAYYFTQDIDYFERRLIIGGLIDISGGGIQNQSTKALFGTFDYDLTDNFTLTTGLRYTREDKSAEIATIRPGGCDNDTRVCTPNFFDDAQWSNLTPKIGFQWRQSDDMQVYGFWTKGFRSGGYNLRNTSPAASPGPFNEESTSVFEVGMKYDNPEKTLRTNIALFVNNISDMQREVNIADPVAGVVQIIDNTADARIWGLEAEVQAQLTSEFTFVGSIGALNSKYKSVRFDINSDGLVNDDDLNLELPRLAPLTWGLGLVFERDISDTTSLFANVNLNHRGLSFYTDNNFGFLNAANMLDANITLELMEGKVALSLYGKNMLNEVTYGGDTQLPFFPGATFSPLNKGRIYGMELLFKF